MCEGTLEEMAHMYTLIHADIQDKKMLTNFFSVQLIYCFRTNFFFNFISLIIFSFD